MSNFFFCINLLGFSFPLNVTYSGIPALVQEKKFDQTTPSAKRERPALLSESCKALDGGNSIDGVRSILLQPLRTGTMSNQAEQLLCRAVASSFGRLLVILLLAVEHPQNDTAEPQGKLAQHRPPAPKVVEVISSH